MRKNLKIFLAIVFQKAINLIWLRKVTNRRKAHLVKHIVVFCSFDNKTSKHIHLEIHTHHPSDDKLTKETLEVSKLGQKM